LLGRIKTPVQTSIQKYVALAHKINSTYMRDEESGLLESKEEQELASAVESDLKKVQLNCI
jgi:hypothetical protein